MGGRGASGSLNKGIPSGVSKLQAFKENAKQFNEAKQKAISEGYTTLKYTDITGKTSTFYYNGVTFSDKKPSMDIKRYRQSDKGTLEVRFDKKKLK